MTFKKFKELIMIEQTFFALPFAYIGVLFAGGATISQWLWVTLALFGARTAGMAFNRVLDADIDAHNPRTENRLIPRGAVTKTSVWILALVSILILIFSSYMLNMLCFYLSFVAAALLATYSLFKRFSASSHFYLGVVEAAAPIGGYLAITGSFDLFILIPGASIMFWIAGLDMLYSVQDMDYDKTEGLHSIPAKLGKEGAFILAGYSYLISMITLLIGGWVSGSGGFYFITIITVIVLFMTQLQTSYNEKENYEEAMGSVFYINRFVSPILFIGMLIDSFI